MVFVLISLLAPFADRFYMDMFLSLGDLKRPNQNFNYLNMFQKYNLYTTRLFKY